MNISNFYKLALFTFFIAFTIIGCKNKESDTSVDNLSLKKQNILFISIDDFRPKISSYGETKMITPNIDKLASEGLQFNNAYTNIAVCGASRASIMTGIRPSEKRFNDFSTRASVDTPNAIPLNRIFKENGYETISYGKIYHHKDDFQEYWTEKDGGQIQSDFQDPISIARVENAERGEYGKKQPTFEYPDVDDYAYNDGKITKRAINKLKALKSENKPFFMAIGYVSPHLPFIQPKKYWDMYDHDAIKLADNSFQPENSPDIAIEAQHNSAEMRKNYLDIPEHGQLDDSLARNLIHGYYASVTYMDALIGELIKGLDDLGLRENTTIVFWSDHGYFLGEHGFWCKHSTFEEAVKIPFIISSPNHIKNKTTASFTELVDVYPTLCNIANIEAPSYLQGESLIPVLENPSTILKTEVYTRYKQGEAVIDKDFSYTEFYEGEKYLGNMLYDNLNDNKQNTDISKLSSNKSVVKKYKEKLKVMREKVNKDPFHGHK
ncbi:MAG: sulfatase [Flavobacteriaceae bacterium]|jgi:arylsulfatase A-like enzyme|nr:sulfatase [Flavobacteriaceae bacterium]|tara:strand:- start:97 stop:1575 length:1479 start_codon:yes stop_codon:yes gene_type:complete